MSIVPALLHAIVHVDGQALVIHPGDRPFVVTPTGKVNLARRSLTLEAVNGIVNELLPVEFQKALNEVGAVQYELPPSDASAERFTVVAARGAEDVWLEVRRRPVSDDDLVPEEMFEETQAAQRVAAVSAIAASSHPRPAAARTVQVPLDDDGCASIEDGASAAEEISASPEERASTEAAVGEDDSLRLPDAGQLWPPVAPELDPKRRAGRRVRTGSVPPAKAVGAER